jgi:hypothetical protein
MKMAFIKRYGRGNFLSIRTAANSTKKSSSLTTLDIYKLRIIRVDLSHLSNTP